ncbi:hypothetical protein [Burkholderia ubonensis]|uniref:hypothetical protein n=1 Tax=Burkholderia ubonensis TaxID=101571 RepID=UPI000A4DFF0B|nr:hypothetical protein [Burkholderia ubonensis]
MQLAIFADSDKIDPIAPHSENSFDHFYAKDAKFFFVYVCASGFVAFSIRQIPPVGNVRTARAARREPWAQLVYDGRQLRLSFARSHP